MDVYWSTLCRKVFVACCPKVIIESQQITASKDGCKAAFSVKVNNKAGSDIIS